VETLGAARLTKEIPAQRAVATIVRRDEITAVLQDPKASPELFLRVTSGGSEETDDPTVIAMTWSRDELQGLLESATGENVVLTFDRDELAQAIGDFEAHGLRERALVFAVAATSALGTGTAIANAMPTSDDGGGPAVTSIAPAVSADSLTDVSSTGGYTAPAAAAATTPAVSMVSDAASGSGYTAPPVQSEASAAGSVTDVSSTGGYTAPAAQATSAADSMISDAASGSGYTAPAAEAGASAAASRVTDVSSAGGYGTVKATGSSGGFLDIHQPGGTTDGLIAGSILLAIAGATFASRRSGTARPA